MLIMGFGAARDWKTLTFLFGVLMKKLLSLLLAVCFMLSCTAALAEDVQLVASFYPVYIFARNILQDVPGVSLSCMTAPSTGCLHDYQLLAGDMLKLSHADALLINGAGMEPFLHDVEHQLPELAIVDASVGIPLLCSDVHHEHEHDHDHDHGEYNAHIWLSPENAIQMVQNMADQLAQLFPQHADTIHANAESYIIRLENAHTQASALLSPVKGKHIVTFHDSFAYFAHAYDLEIAAVVSLEPNDPLSPKMLMDVVHTVEHTGNPPLFAEPQYRSTALSVISWETGAPVFTLDPMVTGDGSLTAYEDTLLQNAKTLLDAFQTP